MIALLPAPRIAFQGAASFPVGRIFCIGRNYAAHAAEMGAAPEAIIFMKPASAIALNAMEIAYPPCTEELHHEVEWVVAIGKAGRPTRKEEARAMVVASGVGLDLTRRDIQAIAKQKGQPWETAKAFDGSAVIGELLPVPPQGLPQSGAITLDVNGERRQTGDLSEMIHHVEALILQIAKLWTLLPGDLIFTGTPSGVGPLQPGDSLLGRIDTLPPLHAQIVRSAEK